MWCWRSQIPQCSEGWRNTFHLKGHSQKAYGDLTSQVFWVTLAFSPFSNRMLRFEPSGALGAQQQAARGSGLPRAHRPQKWSLPLSSQLGLDLPTHTSWHSPQDRSCARQLSLPSVVRAKCRLGGWWFFGPETGVGVCAQVCRQVGGSSCGSSLEHFLLRLLWETKSSRFCKLSFTRMEVQEDSAPEATCSFQFNYWRPFYNINLHGFLSAAFQTHFVE